MNKGIIRRYTAWNIMKNIGPVRVLRLQEEKVTLVKVKRKRNILEGYEGQEKNNGESEQTVP